MKNTHKAAYQAAEIARLRDENRELQSELRAAETELAHKDRLLKSLREQLDKLKEDYDRYLFGYSERVEALAEAERGYNEAAEEARAAKADFEREAWAVIREMKNYNRKGA